MKKYQVTIHFEMSDEFMELVPPHRTYINYLINKDVIDQYAVSMESKRVWVTINAKNKSEVEELRDYAGNTIFGHYKFHSTTWLDHSWRNGVDTRI